MTEVLTDKQVKTRKPHKCWGCLKKFPSGTTMRVVVSVDRDGINQFYFCQHCDNHSEKWSIEDWESTFPGDIGYWVNGQWYPAN